MIKSISFFPTLDEEQILLLKHKLDFSFFYIDKSEKPCVIKQKQGSKNTILLDSKDNNWNSFDYDLNMNLNIEFYDANILYGNSGIAPSNSQLSLGLEWYSSKSKIRKIITIQDSIINKSGQQKLHFECSFPKKTFSSDVSFNLFFYLSKQSAAVNPDETYLNNCEGVLLGTLSDQTIYMKGDESIFPIFKKASNDMKLWDYEISYLDPASDKFFDTFRITINTNHQDYRFLNPDDKSYCYSYLCDIVSYCLSLLFIKLNGDSSLNYNDNCEDGTILYLAKYYKSTLGIDITNNDTLYKTIRNFIVKKGAK